MIVFIGDNFGVQMSMEYASEKLKDIFGMSFGQAKYLEQFILSVDMYKNEYPNTIIWRELGIYFWINNCN